MYAFVKRRISRLSPDNVSIGDECLKPPSIAKKWRAVAFECIPWATYTASQKRRRRQLLAWLVFRSCFSGIGLCHLQQWQNLKQVDQVSNYARKVGKMKTTVKLLYKSLNAAEKLLAEQTRQAAANTFTTTTQHLHASGAELGSYQLHIIIQH